MPNAAVTKKKNAKHIQTAVERKKANWLAAADLMDSAWAWLGTTNSAAALANIARRQNRITRTIAPTPAAANPAACHRETVAIPAMNTGATAQPRFPDRPCTENAWPRRVWATRRFNNVKSAGWKILLPSPATAAVNSSIA